MLSAPKSSTGAVKALVAAQRRRGDPLRRLRAARAATGSMICSSEVGGAAKAWFTRFTPPASCRTARYRDPKM